MNDPDTDLSPLRVLDASESQVADAPACVDAVDLQLGELEGGVKGLGTDPDHDRVYGQGHPLHHLLRKAIFTETPVERRGHRQGDKGGVNRWKRFK